MKILKYGKSSNQYKETCCKCKSKLLVDYSDIACESPFYCDRDIYLFTCPICQTKQTLSHRNEKLRSWYAARARGNEE